MSQYQCGGPSSQNPYPSSVVVGRYPANCLMERMPIHQRIAPLTNIPCGAPVHGALIHLSMGCAPLMGKLHTRYSPVRRSPPQCIATPVLPLDLHVLSLSLAFILSQDQTLRCFKLFLLISLAQDPFLLHLRLDGLFLVLYYWCDICNFLKDLRNQVSSFLVCGCKSRHYFRNDKMFWEEICKFFLSSFALL